MSSRSIGRIAKDVTGESDTALWKCQTTPSSLAVTRICPVRCISSLLYNSGSQQHVLAAVRHTAEPDQYNTAITVRPMYGDPVCKRPFFSSPLARLWSFVDPLSLSFCHYIKRPQVRRESLGYDAGLRVLSSPSSALSISTLWNVGAFLEMRFSIY